MVLEQNSDMSAWLFLPCGLLILILLENVKKQRTRMSSNERSKRKLGMMFVFLQCITICTIIYIHLVSTKANYSTKPISILPRDEQLRSDNLVKTPPDVAESKPEEEHAEPEDAKAPDAGALAAEDNPAPRQENAGDSEEQDSAPSAEDNPDPSPAPAEESKSAEENAGDEKADSDSSQADKSSPAEEPDEEDKGEVEAAPNESNDADVTVIEDTSEPRVESDEQDKPQEQVEESDSEEEKNVAEDLPNCPEKSPLLVGERDVNLVREPASLEATEKNNPTVSNGGWYKPPDCKALSKVAIIIPFRNRDRHLLFFLEYYHPILQRMQLEYRIYVMNQFGMDTFNKDKLMNVGYVTAKRDGFDCFVFHDVDVVLTNDHCLYRCQHKPVHLAPNIDKFGGLVYDNYLGGAVMMSLEQFEKINGMSNIFWGWGGEDDDIYYRVSAAGLGYTRFPMNIAKYKMVPHKRDKGNDINPERFDLLQNSGKNYLKEGLNTLEYKVVSTEIHPLYVNMTIDVLVPDKYRRKHD